MTKTFISDQTEQFDFTKHGQILRKAEWINWEKQDNDKEKEAIKKLQQANQLTIGQNLERLFE